MVEGSLYIFDLRRGPSRRTRRYASDTERHRLTQADDKSGSLLQGMERTGDGPVESPFFAKVATSMSQWSSTP